MSLLRLQECALATAASTPAGKGVVQIDSADWRIKASILPSSPATPHGGRLVHVLSDVRGNNRLTNSDFRFFQRQTPGTLTSYNPAAGGRAFGADRWGLTPENASVQIARVDQAGAAETGLSSRFYAQVKKITSAGKVILTQTVECLDTIPHRGRRVRIQFVARNGVGSHTLRLALVQLTSAGTVDVFPATIASAFGANGTDPTWGTNLAAVTPEVANSASTIAASGFSCVLTSQWRRYGGVLTVPATCKNLMVAVFTNAQMAADDWFGISEIAMHDGDEERDFWPAHATDELHRVQRFCSKTFPVDVAPVQNLGVQTGEFRCLASTAGAAQQRCVGHTFPVAMRVPPTITRYNPAAADANFYDFTAAGSCGLPVNITNLTERTLMITCFGNAATVPGNALGVHLLAESEL